MKLKMNTEIWENKDISACESREQKLSIKGPSQPLQVHIWAFLGMTLLSSLASKHGFVEKVSVIRVTRATSGPGQ
jgi:hypothetical protein